MAYGQTRYAAGEYGASAAATASTTTLKYPLGYVGASRILSVAPVNGTLVGTSHVDVVIPELES